MKTVWDAFAAQARHMPAAKAICGEADYGYGELMERATVLARALLERTAPGALIALDATGPVAGVTAFLAAAQAGCAVLPLNAESPPMHRAAVLAEASADLLLREVDEHHLAVEQVGGGDAAAGSAGRWPGTMHDVAYVMYTSGSTGRPKGVVVTHDALLRRLRGLAGTPGLGPRESIFAMTALSFDPCMAELLLPLTVGGRIVAAPVTARLDPAIFAAVTSEYEPSVIQATPSFWRLVLAWGWKGAPGSRLWCGGEPLTPSLADRLLRASAALWNVYGPTEGTIWVSAARVATPDSVGLGRPLEGTSLYLEDEAGHPLTSPHQPGEILLYGGLALGYLNQPGLTAERFCTRDTPDGPKRCYRTGDRARYRDDGLLEFLGRTDAQVKLRGHRIELGELEAVLEEHPAVHEAAAVLRDAGSAEKAHIAVFLTSDGNVTSRQIRAWLAERLPLSMRPSRISFLPSLPRTVTGKVDRVGLASGPPDSQSHQ